MDRLTCFIRAMWAALVGDITVSEILDYQNYLMSVRAGALIELPADAVYAEDQR